MEPKSQLLATHVQYYCQYHYWQYHGLVTGIPKTVNIFANTSIFDAHTFNIIVNTNIDNIMGWLQECRKTVNIWRAHVQYYCQYQYWQYHGMITGIPQNRQYFGQYINIWRAHAQYYCQCHLVLKILLNVCGRLIEHFLSLVWEWLRFWSKYGLLKSRYHRESAINTKFSHHLIIARQWMGGAAVPGETSLYLPMRFIQDLYSRGRHSTMQSLTWYFLEHF